MQRIIPASKTSAIRKLLPEALAGKAILDMTRGPRESGGLDQKRRKRRKRNKNKNRSSTSNSR